MIAATVALLALGVPAPGSVNALHHHSSSYSDFDALLGDHPAVASSDEPKVDDAPDPKAQNAPGTISCDKSESYIADAYAKSGEIRKSITEETSKKALIVARIAELDQNITTLTTGLDSRTAILRQGLTKGKKIFEGLQESKNPIITDMFGHLAKMENHVKVLHNLVAIPWRDASENVRQHVRAKENMEGQAEMADARMEALHEQLDDVHAKAAKFADCVDTPEPLAAGAMKLRRTKMLAAMKL